jgi:adenylate cyclase
VNIRLETLDSCFHGIVPGVIATCDREGTPNVSYLSMVHLVDEKHVALSCQFFNKTRQNLDENPLATLEVYEPSTFDAYRLRVRFVRSETGGPVFDAMAPRIQAIASLTGMAGVFKLRSADVCEVLSIEKRDGFMAPAPPPERNVLPDGPLTELRGLTLVSERVMRATDLESLMGGALAALHEVFGFTHGMILVPDDTGNRLTTIASHGYGDAAIGSEVLIGEGLIGSVAQARQLVRIACVSSDLRYGRAIRAEYQQSNTAVAVAAEVPLPHLVDAESQMAIPLLAQDRLVGVLALEARSSLTFSQWHEAFLQVLANQIAAGIDRMLDQARDDEPGPPARPSAGSIARSERKRSFTYYRNDDCVFVDGEYLIRNVPAKILWKILRSHEADGRTEYSNRELRLDPALGLPAFKDNLESRLILLRKRLEQKCPDVRIVSTKRGRFALEVDCTVELVERETS